MVEEAGAPKKRPDYSWDGLKDHVIEGHPSGARTLQDYWRLDPDGGAELDDNDLWKRGLIRTVGGVQWHLVHLPATDPWKAKSSGATRSIIAGEIGRRLAASVTGQINGCVLLDGAVLEAAQCLSGGGGAGGLPRLSLKDARFIGAVDFAGWRFGEGTSFKRAEFQGDASFAHAAFHGHVDFSGARFAGKADFGKSHFCKSASFDDVEFEAWNFFEGAQFVQGASFEDALFHEYALFKKAVFHQRASFRYATFFKKADFHLAKFLGWASFERTEFFGVAAFLEATFDAKFSFQRALFKHLCEFSDLKVKDKKEACWRSAFDGAEISTLFNLERGPFRIISAFDGAIISGWIRFPIEGEGRDVKAFRSEALRLARSAGMETQDALAALEGGARILKRAMAQQADSLREHQFYRFEIEARRHIRATPRGERLVSYVYSQVADYGRQIGRPLGCLFLSFGLFAVVYWLAACWMEPAPDVGARISLALEASASGIVRPFFVWDPRWLAASGWRSGFEWPGALLLFQAISTLQSLISLGLVFLSALAVRRRFQIS
ncbi:MAG: pentapeptide repeat-containing protein [Oceanicaulis sp.]|nr:pentapeptide repeat-containing protein [Oceanicaulis sp.]